MVYLGQSSAQLQAVYVDHNRLESTITVHEHMSVNSFFRPGL